MRRSQQRKWGQRYGHEKFHGLFRGCDTDFTKDKGHGRQEWPHNLQGPMQKCRAPCWKSIHTYKVVIEQSRSLGPSEQVALWDCTGFLPRSRHAGRCWREVRALEKIPRSQELRRLPGFLLWVLGRQDVDVTRRSRGLGRRLARAQAEVRSLWSILLEIPNQQTTENKNRNFVGEGRAGEFCGCGNHESTRVNQEDRRAAGHGHGPWAPQHSQKVGS